MIKDLIRDVRSRMEKTADTLVEDLRGIRTGRASPALLERISVEYYGVVTPLNQVSTISAPEPRLLTIRPWEASMIAPIEKAILKSDLGLTPTNDGKLIPEEGRCVTCHFPPLYTDRSLRDVGTKMWLDRNGKFDVPHLTNIYASAPYMHIGIADTLEEIWTRFNPDDKHGVTNDMTKDQLNDLIEYLNTL